MPKNVPNDLDRIEGAVAQARDILASECEAWVYELVQELYSAGLAAWQIDPEVDGVVGLMNLQHPDRNRAWLVVYLADRDAEISDDFEKMQRE